MEVAGHRVQLGLCRLRGDARPQASDDQQRVAPVVVPLAERERRPQVDARARVNTEPKSNNAGMTPATVTASPLKMMGRPTIVRSAWKRRSHK
jgi:hypothetical protein